jgi:hypothetical protein
VEDVFGLPPIAPPIGRSSVFAQPSYRIEPDKLLDGTAAWNQWSNDMLYLIGQASADELDKLSTDNKSLLGMLRRSEEHSDGYRKIIDGAAARRAELAAEAP